LKDLEKLNERDDYDIADNEREEEKDNYVDIEFSDDFNSKPLGYNTIVA